MAHVCLPSSQHAQSANNLHGPAYSLQLVSHAQNCTLDSIMKQNASPRPPSNKMRPPPDSIMKQNAHLPSQQWQRADPNSPESIYVRVHECIYAVLRPMISADRPRYHAVHIQFEQTLSCISSIVNMSRPAANHNSIE